MTTAGNTTQPIATPVANACRRLGIGRTKLYELIAKGEIRSIKIGTRTLIPETELQRFVAAKLGDAA